MEEIGRYVLTLTAASVLCGIARQLVGEKGTVGSLLKMLTGIFILFTAISPLISVRLGSVDDFLTNFKVESQQSAAQGRDDAKNVLRDIIIEKTSTYILDKAREYGADLSVEVMVEDSDVPTPCAVTVRGLIAPFAKQQMQAMIRDDLGIPLEEQIWINQ